MTHSGVPQARAVVDPGLTAVLHDLTPLVYSHGGWPERDVPAHVRAASALRRSAGRLVIVQDDVNVLVVHGGGAGSEAVLLPAGESGLRTFEEARGNKHAKMDLEACAALPDGRLLAFGSGSTRARERLVVFHGSGTPRIVSASDLYAGLRTAAAFAGSELNVEGALVLGGVLRLFQRGNGAPVGELLPVDATCDLRLAELLAWLDRGGPAPVPCDIVQYDLGRVGEVRFTFTDAALMPDGRVAFLACAEASPDTYNDGEVLGCRFGIIEGRSVRAAPVCHADGRSCSLKLEGIECIPGAGTAFDVVADMDRPEAPALIGRLEVRET